MIVKAALIAFRDNVGVKEIMMVRPQNKPFLIFPGGKQEQGEDIEAALRRELQEDLLVTLAQMETIGMVEGMTPDGRDLLMHLHMGRVVGTPQPNAEIEEIVWLSRMAADQHKHLLTPITVQKVFPLLTSKLLW